MKLTKSVRKDLIKMIDNLDATQSLLTSAKDLESESRNFDTQATVIEK